MREKAACFTGHREIQTDTTILAQSLMNIVEAKIGEGYHLFYAGGARGFDGLASEIILKQKRKYPQIHLILVLPFENQYEHESGWTQKDIEQYQFLKERASRVVCLQEKYSKGCYDKRNRYLVDHSSLCIAYQVRYSGGTAYTTRYAAKMGVQVVRCMDGEEKYNGRVNPRCRPKTLE